MVAHALGESDGLKIQRTFQPALVTSHIDPPPCLVVLFPSTPHYLDPHRRTQDIPRSPSLGNLRQNEFPGTTVPQVQNTIGSSAE